MNLNELLNETWGVQKVLLMTTATNGLYAHDAKLLAVCTLEVLPEQGSVNLVMNQTTGIDLQKSSQYHQITESDMLTYGIDSNSFQGVCEALFTSDTVVFTYNIPFQRSFLSRISEDVQAKLYDLPLIEKTVRNKYSFDTEELVTLDSFYRVCLDVTTPTSINNVCRHLAMSKAPAPGELPLLRALAVLQRLYSVALTEELSLLQS